jgi:uncharacterized membrane protein YjfL (UPF0719 family)
MLTTSTAVAIIVALAIYPFLVFYAAWYLKRCNDQAAGFLSGGITAGIGGMLVRTVFLPTVTPKYLSTNAAFGVVVVLATTATGALIGALCDRWIQSKREVCAAKKGCEEKPTL